MANAVVSSQKTIPPPVAKAPVVVVQPIRCPSCQSTQREDYRSVTEQEFAGIAPDGKPYTHIIRRRTKCKECGQARIDRSYENRIK